MGATPPQLVIIQALAIDLLASVWRCIWAVPYYAFIRCLKVLLKTYSIFQFPGTDDSHQLFLDL